ncbi:KUP/HAK/KT family potassium transporter [Dyadobacter sp. LHD-138]|uniref:KUP/HAK/KT family potassium transporter n=1 Tax=Dyadobacter sp. LHD-138 TaxID=3071413 RepID=UPI0027E12F75|nr:KUP/HAK/KT family potassium transporter [Dyadobacter sp. LHD-138]MDQ6482549.1 KUP/HAK/KT family potassium transporter [Dyadobacter sp. LHD-138]
MPKLLLLGKVEAYIIFNDNKHYNLNHDNIQQFHKQVKLAGLLISTGIVFGDIGTSPLYTLNALFHPGEVVDPVKALGILSCIIWTLTLQTTLKYILITLQADNNGEGGIFSLYTLIRRYFGKWSIVLAVMGGAFLIADGIITPPISVSSAIEGLQKVYPELNTVPIVIAIIVLLFVIQQLGTQQIGKFFGPVMLVWFSFIGIIGLRSAASNLAVFKALNPYYAYELLAHYPAGFWLLGGIFLCTTGAEALYSDMGHVGRNNIRVSWIYIKITLVLSYAGQTAWLIDNGVANEISPFYNIIPEAIYIPSVILASMATVIASQALISGCFTLVNEAIRLGLWPRNKVIFPGSIKGQMYIPFFNWFLMSACILTVLYFRESKNMEAAFGLSVTLTMLITTFLISLYLKIRRVPVVVITLITALFLSVEISFLIANLQKLHEGGWIMLVVGGLLTVVMLTWYNGKMAQSKLIATSQLSPLVLQKLMDLSTNAKIRNHATNLIYLTSTEKPGYVERRILDSIFNAPAKRADVYWFLHVHVTDEPYTMQYEAKVLAPNDVYQVVIRIGFRIEPKVDLFFRKIVTELIQRGELNYEKTEEKKYDRHDFGDYRFMITNSFLSYDNNLPYWKNLLIKSYYNLKLLGVQEDVNFGLDASNVVFERYPLVFEKSDEVRLERIQ